MSEEYCAMKGVVPHLTIRDNRATEAIDFYIDAFGASESGRHMADDGKRILHAHLEVNGGPLMLNDDFPEMAGGAAPAPTGVGLHLDVPDADAAWEWTGKISPAFDIEGRSLYDSVEWLGREAGLQVVYANDSVLARAQTVRVHGSIEGLATRDALVTVLTGSGFEFDLGPERVRISATEAR